MKTTNYPSLPTVMIDGQPTYPTLANEMYLDGLYGPRIQRRVKRLLLDHSDGLSEVGHHWYFGYLVNAYVKTHYGIKMLLNADSVTNEIFHLCLDKSKGD
ncbi:hypothetical protein LEMES_01431 [Leuconostoc mesenteroides]|nr:hypothetical protein LEMES_01431 [Leuconostoc mesenteroides]